MDVFIDLDVPLHLEQPVYRIVDFFAAADIVLQQKIRFSRGDMFIDKNEGIDRLLNQLDISRRTTGLGMGWSNRESAEKYHENLKRSHYIVCCTENPESVAMWSLYSNDLCSVRIRTRLSKLRMSLVALLNKWSLARLSKDHLGKRVIVAKGGRISKVNYESLQNLTRKVERRAKAFERIYARYERNKKPLPTLGNIPARFYEREEKREISSLKVPFNLKDESYSHELEIRVVASFGEEICTDRMLEEKEFLDPSHKYHVALKMILSAWGQVSTGRLPEYDFTECCSDFIEAVAIDPRCPAHKIKFMEEWFRKHGIVIEKSNCFGYLPDGFEMFPKW